MKKTKFSRQLRTARLNKGHTVKKAAGILRLSMPTLSRLEAGNPPKAKNVLKLAAYANMSAEDALRGMFGK